MKNCLLVIVILSGVVGWCDDTLDKAMVEIKVLKREVKLLGITNRGYRKKIKKLEKKLKKQQGNQSIPVAVAPRLHRQSQRFMVASANINTARVREISMLKNRIMGLEERMDKNKIMIRQGKVKYAHMKSVYLKRNKKMLISSSTINGMKRICFQSYVNSNKMIERSIQRYTKRVKELEAQNK